MSGNTTSIRVNFEVYLLINSEVSEFHNLLLPTSLYLVVAPLMLFI